MAERVEERARKQNKPQTEKSFLRVVIHVGSHGPKSVSPHLARSLGAWEPGSLGQRYEHRQPCSLLTPGLRL